MMRQQKVNGAVVFERRGASAMADGDSGHSYNSVR
jgi:hypothetical protein